MGVEDVCRYGVFIRIDTTMCVTSLRVPPCVCVSETPSESISWSAAASNVNQLSDSSLALQMINEVKRQVTDKAEHNREWDELHNIKRPGRQII